MLRRASQSILYSVLCWLGLVMIATPSLATSDHRISLSVRIPVHQAGLTYTRHIVNGIGYDIGVSAHQSAKQASHVLYAALPYIGIRYDQPIKKTGIIPYVAGGVGVMLPVLSNVRAPHIARVIRYGIQYDATRMHRLWIEHRIQRSPQHVTSFNDNAMVVGISFRRFTPIRYRPSPPSVPSPSNIPKRPPSLQQRPAITPSIHQQTQSIMKDLSWPTY